MSDNQYYYPQEGQSLQRPVKKRKHRFIKVLSILLLIAVLTTTLTNYFLEPVLISRLTKGYLFGFQTTRVTEEDLENILINKPTEKDIKAFSKFAKQLSNRIYLSLSSEQKEDFNEIKEGVKQISARIRAVDFAQSSSENNVFTTSFAEDTKASFIQDVVPSLYFNMASVFLAQSKSLPFKGENADEENEEELYNPDLLNDISVMLYANGYPELASAVSSMAAAEHPENPISALNFGTVLREVNADEDAFHALQYALRLSPGSEPILYSLGMCALDLKKTAYAETCFSKILSLNASSGPGHQGMMLCYMDAENYSSAFLHMIEGAREGYTTMVTETYKALRQNPNEYMEIAKQVLEQYTFDQLMDFSKSRTPFDSTLDTPAGQLNISRQIKLGRDSASVRASSDKLQDGLQYAMAAFSHGKATIDDALNMVPGGEIVKLIEDVGGLLEQSADTAPDEVLKPVSKSILEKIFGSAANGATVSNDGWLGISYEAEVFWLNILDDYVQIQLEDNLEEYFEKPYDDAFKDPDSFTPSLNEYHETLSQLAQSNPLMAGTTVLNNLITNDSAYDVGVQKADQKDMDKFLQDISPKLEEGYKKTAELMEEYWLHYGSILGQIGHDETYNRYQQQRKTTVACALTPYVVGGTINCFIVSMNLSVVGSDGSGGGGVILPQFPEFPDSQMGEKYNPPPKPTTSPDDEPGYQDEEPSQDESTPSLQEETTGSGENSSEPSEEKPKKPGHGNPGEGEIITEDSGTLFIGPLSVTYNEKSGWEVDLTAFGSINVRYDKRTGDVSLFGGAGLSIGAADSGASARAGIYATINSRTMDITSGSRATMEGQIAGNGIGVEKQACLTTGADTTTVSAILLHKKSSQTIYNN